jgi:hypothetical protein
MVLYSTSKQKGNTMTITQELATNAHNVASVAAENAAQAFADKYCGGGDRGPCGFAWVIFTPENKGNTKLGKAERKMFESLGFRKDYTGKAWRISNPAQWRGQGVDTIAAGAQAYANKFTEITGIKVGYADRMD